MISRQTSFHCLSSQIDCMLWFGQFENVFLTCNNRKWTTNVSTPCESEIQIEGWPDSIPWSNVVPDHTSLFIWGTKKLYSLVRIHPCGHSALYQLSHPRCTQYELKTQECRGPIGARLLFTIQKWVPVSNDWGPVPVGRSERVYPLSPRYWHSHVTSSWFVIGYRKYHKLWRSCSIVTLSVALVLSAMLDKPRRSRHLRGFSPWSGTSLFYLSRDYFDRYSCQYINQHLIWCCSF